MIPVLLIHRLFNAYIIKKDRADGLNGLKYPMTDPQGTPISAPYVSAELKDEHAYACLRARARTSTHARIDVNRWADVACD